MKVFGLMLVAIALTVILIVPAVIVQIIRHVITSRSLSALWWDIAIGLDQLGGAILYGEPDWTVSSRTYFLRVDGNKYAAFFERFIDSFFGKKHCEISYKNEFGSNKL